MEKHDRVPQAFVQEKDRPRVKADVSVRSQFVRSERVTDCFQQSKFKTGDEVYLDKVGSRGLEGPYLISSVPSTGRYVLCIEDGTKVENGKEFEENVLRKK